MEARRFGPIPAHRAVILFAITLAPALNAAAATHRTTNFAVEHASADVAKQVAEHAEACRLSIARAWLGKDLADWTTPCPIRVKLTRGEAGGLTSFGFHRGKVSDQSMTVEGRLDRILASSLPHEVTHTIFAAYFGAPMPRWADEGASLLSEDVVEHNRHDQIVDALIGRRGQLTLDRLFTVEEYPEDLMSFYGQGYSISRFLVEIGGRPRFLAFVKEGSKTSWDVAARNHYGLAGTRELDRAWRAWHQVAVDTRSRPAGTDQVLVQTEYDPRQGR